MSKKPPKTEGNSKVLEFIRETEKEVDNSEQEIKIEIPEQVEFYKTPVRFGNIPVDTLPLGCDQKEQYRKIYPRVQLPFQSVERISFGYNSLDPNKLIFGDNLHVMRMLPSNSIDLIYIDPPFFSGRNYNVVFGDANEIRSFSDIWEGGMPGYLIWLNARLLEMKRLLKPTGSIFVHLDWHASHYVKLELDKIFGYDNFRNDITWKRASGVSNTAGNQFPRNSDHILFYTKSKKNIYNRQYGEYRPETLKNYHYSDNRGQYRLRDTRDYSPETLKKFEEEGKLVKGPKGGVNIKQYLIDKPGTTIDSVWADIKDASGHSDEAIGYPTQKPEALLERIINASTNEGDVVADFFCGGGTTPVVAQRMKRRWIASDISRIAVSVTRDRLLRAVLSSERKVIQQSFDKIPDVSIEHWGVYEVPELVKLKVETFRNFIITAYNGRLATSEGLIHGYKNQTPLFVGNPSQDEPVTEKEVINFAKEIVKRKGYHQGTMISWAFTPEAQNAAQQLEAQHALAIDFVKIQLVPIESNQFREHITSKHPEYKNLLKFILPPEVRISINKIKDLEYEFDVSESVSLNPNSKIINVQWDFNYNGERFISTPGYSFIRMENNKPVLKVRHVFNNPTKSKIACKVQDDEGGEKIEVINLEIK